MPVHIWNRFIRGVDTRQAPDALEAGYALTAHNLQYAGAGDVRTTSGLVVRGGNTTLRGTPQHLAHHKFPADSALTTFLVTTLTLYFYSVDNDAWEYHPGTASTTLAANASATDTYVDVTDSTGFADGENIGITLDDGTQHQTTIDGAPSVGGGAGGSDRVNIDDAMPSAATSGNACVRAVVFAGVATAPVQSVPWKAEQYLLITNGVDEPVRVSTSDCVDIPGLAFTGTTINTCRSLAVQRNQVFMLNTTENSTNLPQRIRGCDIGDETTWDDSTGSAFYEDIPEPVGAGMRVEPLGPDLALYFERGIAVYRYQGLEEQLWLYSLRVTGEGLSAVNGLIPLQGSHILFGDHDIFAYAGGTTLIPIGSNSGLDRSPIASLLFGLGVPVLSSLLPKSSIISAHNQGEVWFIAPNSAGEMKQVLRFSLSSQGWFTRDVPEESLGGLSTEYLGDSVTWADLDGTWLEQTTAWEGLSSSYSEIWVMGSTQIYAFSAIASDDAGTAIGWTLQTGEFREPPYDIRIDRIDIVAKGEPFVVDYSEDGGITWTSLGTVTPGATLTKLLVGANVTLPSVRLRLTGTGQTTISWVSLVYDPESLE